MLQACALPASPLHLSQGRGHGRSCALGRARARVGLMATPAHADVVAGLAVFIALSAQGWERLLGGAVSEADLSSADDLFDPARDAAAYLHCYHIERLAPGAGFADRVLRDAAHLGHRVGGLSGLCVTAAGRRLFGESWGCGERAPRCEEHVWRAAATGTRRIVQGAARPESPSELLRLLLGCNFREACLRLRSTPFELECRCQMMATRPGEPSAVWSVL